MTRERKSIMRSLGEFFGHIAKAARTDPGRERKMVRRSVEEEHRGDVTLRRTTIEEIEITGSPDVETKHDGDE